MEKNVRLYEPILALKAGINGLSEIKKISTILAISASKAYIEKHIDTNIKTNLFQKTVNELDKKL